MATTVNQTDHSAYAAAWLVEETAVNCVDLQMVLREKSRTEWGGSTQGRDPICNGMVRESFLRRRPWSSPEGGEEMRPKEVWEEHSRQREEQVQRP